MDGQDDIGPTAYVWCAGCGTEGPPKGTIDEAILAWNTRTNTSASVTGNVGGDVGGNVTGSVGSLAAQAKADVNAGCHGDIGADDGTTKAAQTD